MCAAQVAAGHVPRYRAGAWGSRDERCDGSGRGVEDPVRGCVVDAAEVFVQDLLEHRLVGCGPEEQGRRRVQLSGVDSAENLLRAAVLESEDGPEALQEAATQDRMAQIGPPLIQGGKGIPLRGRAHSEAGYLREDEPHPVASLGPAAELREGPLVRAGRVLGFHETR